LLELNLVEFSTSTFWFWLRACLITASLVPHP
jgi:hypothetical protein